MLSKEQILGAQDLVSRDVEVPEWGGSVRVRMMTGTERDAMGQSMIGADGKADTTNYRARLVAFCVVGEDGQRLFSADDVPALAAKSSAAIERVFAAAEDLNRLSASAVEAASGN